jgi:hypothetical protein
MVVHLPARRDVCADRSARTGGSCLDAHREPRHERRSSFTWLDTRTLAFVTLDRARDVVSVVLATFGDAGAEPVVAAVPCEPGRVLSHARCPSPRQPWRVDNLRLDDDGHRVWVHFRERLPEVPSGWLALSTSP